MNEKETIIIRVRAYPVEHPRTKKKVLAVRSRERFTPDGALHQFGWIRTFVKNQTSDELEAVEWWHGKGTYHTLVCPEEGNYVWEYRDSPYCSRFPKYEILTITYDHDDVGVLWAYLEVQKLP